MSVPFRRRTGLRLGRFALLALLLLVVLLLLILLLVLLLVPVLLALVLLLVVLALALLVGLLGFCLTLARSCRALLKYDFRLTKFKSHVQMINSRQARWSWLHLSPRHPFFLRLAQRPELQPS